MSTHTGGANPSGEDNVHDQDFQFALRELLAAYQPILEEELKRARSPEELKKEAEGRPPNCEKMGCLELR